MAFADMINVNFQEMEEGTVLGYDSRNYRYIIQLDNGDKAIAYPEEDLLDNQRVCCRLSPRPTGRRFKWFADEVEVVSSRAPAMGLFPVMAPTPAPAPIHAPAPRRGAGRPESRRTRPGDHRMDRRPPAGLPFHPESMTQRVDVGEDVVDAADFGDWCDMTAEEMVSDAGAAQFLAGELRKFTVPHHPGAGNETTLDIKYCTETEEVSSVIRMRATRCPDGALTIQYGIMACSTKAMADAPQAIRPRANSLASRARRWMEERVRGAMAKRLRG